ncbi:hypothetical protein FRC01_000082 [Tulasnella sp. 417]|nr:hypothetical protein FRC01_000082 [Tulasnella sp. 417]
MPPTEKLERIRSYCARIRTLRFRASNVSNWGSGTVAVFRALCNDKLDQYFPIATPLPSLGLFPNLHTLEWKAKNAPSYAGGTLDAVSYFLSPSLKRLYVSGIVGRMIRQGYRSLYSNPSVDYASFFRALNDTKGLRLESLDLRGYTVNAAQELELGDEVALFLHEHRDNLLHFYTWTPVFVRLFRQELWELSRLRSLEVIADDELQAARFVEGLVHGAAEMEDLNLTVLPYREPCQWQGLWDALKGLRKLTKLRLAVPEVHELGEKDARSMREAWPALSHLYIVLISGDWRGFRRESQRGLSSKFLSAISCYFSQSLTTLGLCFEPKIRSELQISPVRFEKLQLLYLQPLGPVDDPYSLAKYLAHILPPGANLKGNWYYNWEQVVQCLERERAKLITSETPY